MSVPASLIAGDTWEWTQEFADYPAPTWVVTYYFELLGSTFNVQALASGTAHAATITAATSAKLKPGRYRWFARAVSGAIAKTAGEGVLVVEIDPAAAGTTDRRSWARRTLDAVEATLENRATKDQLNTQVRDIQISRMPLADLMTLRDRLRSEVEVEEGGPNAGSSRNIKARLTRV